VNLTLECGVANYLNLRKEICDAMKRQLIIKGQKVQDVNYKLLLFESAELNGLMGFHVRNVDGDVEVLMEGDEKNIDNFIKTVMTSHPLHVKVEKIITEEYEGIVMSIESFYRLFKLQLLVETAEIMERMVQALKNAELKNQ
jgi:acylphosphatase